MDTTTREIENLRKKIEKLSVEKIHVVEDFVDYLYQKEQFPASSVDEQQLLLQQESLSRIWSDEEDLYEL
jgi:hypothetical protein